jgi:hypothetical protein
VGAFSRVFALVRLQFTFSPVSDSLIVVDCSTRLSTLSRLTCECPIPMYGCNSIGRCASHAYGIATTGFDTAPAAKTVFAAKGGELGGVDLQNDPLLLGVADQL